MLDFIRGEDITIVTKEWDGTTRDSNNNPLIEETKTVLPNTVVQYRNSAKEYNNDDYAFKTKVVIYVDKDVEVPEDSYFIIRDTVWVKDGRKINNTGNIFYNQMLNVKQEITLKQSQGYNIGADSDDS